MPFLYWCRMLRSKCCASSLYSTYVGECNVLTFKKMFEVYRDRFLFPVFFKKYMYMYCTWTKIDEPSSHYIPKTLLNSPTMSCVCDARNVLHLNTLIEHTYRNAFTNCRQVFLHCVLQITLPEFAAIKMALSVVTFAQREVECYGNWQKDSKSGTGL